MKFFNKNKKKIIAAIAIVLVLAAAFWYGNGTKESRGFSVKNSNNQVQQTEQKETMQDKNIAATASDNLDEKDLTVHNKGDETGEDKGEKETDPDSFLEKDDSNSESVNADIQNEASQNQTQEQSGQQQSDAIQENTNAEKKTFTCTISIDCKNILNNMESLKDSKKSLIPNDGWILNSVSVEVNQGESVYDALVRACKANNILTDASYTPMYGTYYVKGINNIYEQDCGSESGWMFKVNGVTEKKGASSYKLSDADVIEWRYTCNMGKDV